jgi:hypothetical protein
MSSHFTVSVVGDIDFKPEFEPWTLVSADNRKAELAG